METFEEGFALVQEVPAESRGSGHFSPAPRDEPHISPIRRGPELEPEPEQDCNLDWVGLLLPRHTRARPNCAGDTVGSAKRVLDYGERWKRSGRVCESKRSGLHCWNEDGLHFELSGDDWKRWSE